MKTHTTTMYMLIVKPLEEQMTVLTAALKKQQANLVLQALILDEIYAVLKGRCRNYNRLDYLQELQNALMKLCENSDQKQIDQELRELLFSYNFNSFRFIKYYRSVIAAELAELPLIRDQFDLLYGYEKLFNISVSRKPKSGFHPKGKKTKDLMLDFVCAELRYRKKKYKPVEPSVLVSKGGMALKSYKIRASFSVDVLAYFVKLMVRAKLIEMGTRTELLTFIAGIFQTPGIGSSGISPGSLETKYKQVVQTTAKSVRILLLRMLKLLEEDFNFS